MDDELFDELLDSVREMGQIMRGEKEPSRVFRVENGEVTQVPPDEPNVASIRAALGLSQKKFAALLGISPGTLRNWEQGIRRPQGSARVLLRVAARDPEAVLRAAHPERAA